MIITSTVGGAVVVAEFVSVIIISSINLQWSIVICEFDWLFHCFLSADRQQL